MGSSNVYEVHEQDRYLPLANVGRIMKDALPEHAKLSRESKICMQECASEFISFITSEAADRCVAQSRKLITGDDILSAMNSLGFENYATLLMIYLAQLRDVDR